MHYVWMFLVGLVVGAIARLLMPGEQKMGWIMTAILGIAGSFVGGFIGNLISRPADGVMFNPAGLIMSVIGALILLFAWGKLRG
jgi:uncharacterized membrane protein YeaQ/YmgE (transglycosylase-associated protein family)